MVHVYQSADDRKSAAKRFSGKRGASALLLAALVAALMVVVNEVAHNWTDGHMLGAWVVLWVEGISGSANVFTLSADGRQVSTHTTSARGPVTLPWNTTSVPNGAHTLTATIRDAAGNTGSVSLSVLVRN